MPGVLAEVVPRVDDHRVPPHAQLHRALGQAHGHPQDVRHHVLVPDPVRAGPRLGAARVGADQPDVVPGGHLGELRVHPAPGVVQQVRARLADRLADLVPPGVHADHRVGVALAQLGHEGDGAPQLLLDRDLVARPGLHPADVQDRRALGHRAVGGGEGGLVGEGRALVEERVRGPVDDRHDHQLVVTEFPRSQAQCHRCLLQSSCGCDDGPRPH